MKKLVLGLLIIAATFQSNAQTFTTYNKSIFPDFLYDDNVSDIAIDQSGTIWVSGYWTGIGKLQGGNYTAYDEWDGLLSDNVNDITVAPDNNLWVSTYKGLAKMDLNGNTLAVYDSSNTIIPGKEVSTVVFGPDGRMWVSSENNLFSYQMPVSFDGTDWTLHDELTGNAVGDEIFGYEFVGNTVWMASDAGVLEYKDKVYNSYFKAHTGLWSAYALEKDKDDVVWFVGNWGVLNRKNGTWNFRAFILIHSAMENARAYCMKIQGNYIWIGTHVGLFKYDMSTQKAQHWDENNSDLPTSSIHDIAIDKDGNLWLATAKGLVFMGDGTGVGEKTALNNTDVYPNPCEDILSIKLDPTLNGDITVELIDMKGAVILSKNAVNEPEFTLDVSALDAGVYLLKMETGENTIVKRVLKN